ncbi:MAG: hypothetical protein ACKVP7_11835 [Hyphomicrobiaceae bacterium]
MRNQLHVSEEGRHTTVQIDPGFSGGMRNLETVLYIAAVGCLALWLLTLAAGPRIDLTLLTMAAAFGLGGLFCPRPLGVQAVFDTSQHVMQFVRTVRGETTTQTFTYTDIASVGLIEGRDENDIPFYEARIRLSNGELLILAQHLGLFAPNDRRLRYIAKLTGIACVNELIAKQQAA